MLNPRRDFKVLKHVPITKVNDCIYIGAEVKVIATGERGTVEDIFRKLDPETGRLVGVSVRVKFPKKQFTQGFSPNQLSKI